MSFVKGDLLTKTRKLVNGLAKPQSVWLKAMEQISAYDPPPARLFGLRVLELKELGVTEEEAVAVADMEYRMEKKEKKKAYARLKQIARLQGKKPSPNPYPSAIKERQALERKFVRERFSSPEIWKIVEKIKEERRAERFNGTVSGGF
ncbi:hypothetical protein E1A91_D10G062900v1 [Gossypium mustelinum]|uniref:Uncharacterized protein n=1 Tax=Gossypium mustelinum TaxID=34275 RepID=A0A5D2T3H1_GOSMU|nr:hypothetical protein E1A91_D10G062900v1 [Gossypium mustelinum]TYI59817.1 hypothetical protein E1A91_D10G062900v1 [Gossypium mustelinum]TYI59818.1 hypothetical protein E1A91_D10G062900v1 [Gossypium mustelinum]TYI59819.1 hypothetical protein E1A91_D10G062900v1 [Gossypium mustelinum]TYI59820.1 hypothetical protein E1A91_D10G062900v1 [Gossypium mustelinum]